MKDAAGGRCLAIATAPATAEYERRVPGISASVALYNEILADVFGDAFVAVDFDPDAYLMSDGMHMNVEGHRWLADALIRSLERNDAFAKAVGIGRRGVAASYAATVDSFRIRSLTALSRASRNSLSRAA